MPKLWKIRAWFGHWIGKLITLAMLVAVILGVLYLLKNVLPVWNTVYGLMEPPR